MWPVRPTFQDTWLSVVVAVVGGNFHAIAPRGSRPTTPSWRCSSSSSTFTTTPSISKSSRSRRSCQASQAATTCSTVSCTSTSRFTRKPCSRSQSSHSWWVSNSRPVDLADPVAPHRQRPRGGQRRVELANRAGGRVARVHEGRLAGRGALLVQAGERRQRQVDLAAHLQQRRGVLHAQRNRADRAQVLGHVLAHLAVPAGGAAHQHAVLVDERDGEAVDLRLGHEVHVAHLHALAREVALAAHHPRGQLLLVARVGEREHRLEVRHLLELVERLAADPLRRRVRRAQLLVVGLEVAQLVQQRVVLRIRDLRVVEDVVAVAVVLELSPQLLGSRRGVACLTQRPLSRDAAGARGRSPRAPPRQPGR